MNRPHESEGVVKYACEHIRRPLSLASELPELLAWRAQLRDRRLIGEDPEGYGYGNLSLRRFNSPRFLVTGSQTSGLQEVDARHFAEVTVVDLQRNFLRCVGEIQSSSEALTHAALYEADREVRGVVHVHSRPLWEQHRDRLATTRDDVEYGTPEMAFEVIRLSRRGPVAHRGVIVMGGHRDGVIAYGSSLGEAAQAILTLDAATPLPPPHA